MVRIPNIDDQALEKLADRIKPVARFRIDNNTLVEDETGDLYYVRTPKDLRGVGVNRDPIAERPAGDLSEVARIDTYHTMSTCLNASVAEVLAQIPAGYLDRAVAFEVTHSFPCPRVDYGQESFHKTDTVLYERTG